MNNLVIPPEILALVNEHPNPFPVYGLLAAVSKNCRCGDLAALNADDLAIAAADAGMASSGLGLARVALTQDGNDAFAVSYVPQEASNRSWVFNFDSKVFRSRAELASFWAEQMRVARAQELAWARKVFS